VADLLDAIRDTADELTEPHQHTERIRDWDGNRNPKYRTHTTVQPGLLTQLYQAVAPSNVPAEGSVVAAFTSRPPLVLEAFDRYTSIGAAVLRWCRSLGLERRPTVESNIRALVGAAPRLDQDTARTLLAEMRQWRRWAVVLTGWEKIHTPYRVPCPLPDCGQPGTLRINLTNATAMCRDCGATWGDDDGSIHILANHVATHTVEPRRDTKACGDQHILDDSRY
jgi:hypothetical protein